MRHGGAAFVAAAGRHAAAVVDDRRRPRPQPQLTIRKTGPARAAVGDTIVFTIVVENRGAVPVTNVKVLDNYDLALKPTQASDGWQLAGNDIYWNLPQLLPNQTYERKVECLCQSPAARACNRATVTTQENVRADAEACVEITGRRDFLSVTVTEPTRSGRRQRRDRLHRPVTNNSPVADREVIVAVTLPNEVIPAAGHNGPTQRRREQSDGSLRAGRRDSSRRNVDLHRASRRPDRPAPRRCAST